MICYVRDIFLNSTMKYVHLKIKYKIISQSSHNNSSYFEMNKLSIYYYCYHTNCALVDLTLFSRFYEEVEHTAVRYVQF